MQRPDEQLGYRRLGKVSIDLIEGAIADALGEVAGEPFEASVRKLDFEPTATAALLDEYELVLRVKRRSSAVGLTAEQPQVEGSSDGAGASIDRSLTGLTGRQLNLEWSVGARHALYHHEGRWYHQLRYFPGALFDYYGYVLFRNEDEFKKSPHLNIVQDVHVPRGIASMPGYIRCRTTGENVSADSTT